MLILGDMYHFLLFGPDFAQTVEPLSGKLCKAQCQKLDWLFDIDMDTLKTV